jgi:hypothetical protein
MAHTTLLVFLFIPFFLLAASKKEEFSSKKQIPTRIEVVAYDTGAKEMRLFKNENHHYFTPDTPIVELNISPQVLHNDHYGTIYLYDLAQQHDYLNVLDYDTMEIEGNLTAITLGLADKAYEEKEDHIILPTQHHFKLKTLFKKIDLCRLKYLVVRSHESAPAPIKHILFRKSPKRHLHQTHPLETWAWNPDHLTKTALEAQELSRIYLQMRSGFCDALERMKGSHLTLFGLNGSPEDVFHYEHLLNDIKKLGELKQKYPFITGYQIDVEPYLLEKYKYHKSDILEAYLRLIKVLKQHTELYGLKLSVVIPFWFDHLYLHEKNIGFSVIDTADEVVLMSYRSSLDEVLHISRTLLAYTRLSGKEIRIGIELMPIKDEQHTIYEVIQKNAICLVEKRVSESCTVLKQIREYTIKGEDISFYGQTEKLQHIKTYPVTSPSFKGFVFHHFDLLSTLPPFLSDTP